MVSYYYVIMLFAHEERDNGLALNKALPIKKQYNRSRILYLFLLFLLYGVAIQGIGSALCRAVDLGVVLFNIEHITLAFVFAMIVSAIEVPFIIHFGEKNTRYVLMLIFFVIFLLVGSISYKGINGATIISFCCDSMHGNFYITDILRNKHVSLL